MISIKAKINIGGEGKIEKNGGFISPPNNFINVSAPLSAIIGQKNPKPQNGFILGESILGSGAVYVDSLSYIRGRELSNNNGNFSTPYTIQFVGNELKNAVILFDEENNAYPIFVKYKYSTDNGETWSAEKVTYTNDPRIELVLDTPSNLVEVTIPNWNKANSPLIIMGLYVIGTFEINKENLVSFSSDILDRTNTEYPSYGLISNSANLTCIDFGGDMFELITQKILYSGSIVDIYLDNNVANTEEQICSMVVQRLQYNNANNQVSMQLKDNLENWQEINVEAEYYVPTVSSSKTAKYFYNYLYKKTLALGNYNILAFNQLNSNVQDILDNTTIEYPILESSNLWEEWDKLCQLCFLHMYIDNTNTVVVEYLGGE